MSEPQSIKPEQHDTRTVNLDAATASAFSTQVFENPQEFLRILSTDALPIATFPGAKTTNNDLTNLITNSQTDASDTSHRLTSKDLTESVAKFDKQGPDGRLPDGRLNRAELQQAAMTSQAAQLILANFELIKGLSNDDPGFEKGISSKDIKATVQILDQKVQPIDIFRQRDTERYVVPGTTVGGLAFGGIGAFGGAVMSGPPGAVIGGATLSIEGTQIGGALGKVVGGTMGRATGEINYFSNKSSINKLINDFDKLK